ncbi:MAG: tetratricopeptide repeat protein, partial [Pseudomonadota bacterium]
AWHPLHVESVAWVADRKDLLSALFWLLTMWAYLYYVKRPGFRRYMVIVAAFILGLMSKSMIMTLPFVLLLLDYWPLKRFQWGQACPYMIRGIQRSPALHLFLEKVPLMGLAGISGILTFLMMKGERTVTLVKMMPRETTTANTLVSYVGYMGKMLWPANLAIPYLHPGRLPLWQAGGAALILLCITLLAIRCMKTRPYLFMGWLWYLITLLPVIGLVKMGPDTMADRYTYVPLVGLFMILAWGVPDLVSGRHYARMILAFSAGISLSAILVLSWFQIPHWRNSITLFQHTLRVVPDNSQAHNNMGLALLDQGKIDESISRFREALRIKSSFPDAHNNLGNALLQQGKADEAIAHYQTSLRVSPNNPKYRRNLGLAYRTKGELDAALGEFERSLSINPDFPEVVNDMGLYYVKKGRLDRAIPFFQKAVDLKPDYAYAINNLGQCYHIQGRFDLALAQFKKALAITPDSAEVYCNLGTTLASKGLFTEAEAAIRRAIQLNPSNPIFFNSLATLYAQQGMIDQAIETRNKALSIDRNR